MGFAADRKIDIAASTGAPRQDMNEGSAADAAVSRLFLSTLPAKAADRRLAVAFVALSTLVFLTLARFAKTPLEPVPAFIPLYQSALIFCDLLTALLLFN